MNATARLRLVAAAMVAGALLASSGAASATDTTRSSNAKPARLAYLQGRGDAEIQRRLATLSADANLVNSATHLTSTDRQKLLTLVNSDQSGLSALKTTIDNDTSVQQATADVGSIVTAYRIYVVVDPKIHETIAADRVAAAAQLFKALAANLQTRINNANSSGKKIDLGAQAALDEMNAKVVAAEAAASPVPAEVLLLDPAGYPGNVAALQSAHQALETARQDLKAARHDATTVVADLH